MGFGWWSPTSIQCLPEMSPGYGWGTEALRDGTTWSLAESRVLVRGPGEYRIGPAPGFYSLSRATLALHLPESWELSGR